MTRKLTVRTKLHKGSLVSFRDGFTGIKTFGKVEKIKMTNTPYGRYKLIYLFIEPGLESLGRKLDYIRLKGEIFEGNELIGLANEAVRDAAKKYWQMGVDQATGQLLKKFKMKRQDKALKKK